MLRKCVGHRWGRALRAPVCVSVFVAVLAGWCVVAATADGEASGTSVVADYRHFIIHVPDDAPTIQTAIDYAIDGDEIVIAPGVYYENLHLHGQHVLIRSVAWRNRYFLDNTIIDGGGRDSVISCAGTEVVPHSFWPMLQFAGLTIRNGSAETGGGINANGGGVGVLRCRIENNYAAQAGGGIAGLGRDGVIDYCYITGNRAVVYGGGIYGGTEDMFIVQRCLIAGNEAEFGGGIAYTYVDAKFCTISRNHAHLDSGGTYQVSALARSIVWGNTAGRTAGDIYYDYRLPPGREFYLFSNCFNRDNCFWAFPYATFPWEPNLRSDPLFIDPANWDFHLRADSPAIDWILDLGPGAMDLDLNPAGVNGRPPDRVAPPYHYEYDIGCYEYQPPIVLPVIQATNTPTPPMPGDVLLDGRIDHFDLFELALHWQGSDAGATKADLNASGTVDADDLLLLIEAFMP